MSLRTALNFAKNASEEKVPFRFQFPVQIKQEFESLCDKHNVSMTDMILGLIHSSIDEDKGIYDNTTLNIIEKLEKLDSDYQELERAKRHFGDDEVELENGSIWYIKDEMERNRFGYSALKKELMKRS